MKPFKKISTAIALTVAMNGVAAQTEETQPADAGYASLTVTYTDNNISTSEIYVKSLKDCEKQAKISASAPYRTATIACPTEQGRIGITCYSEWTGIVVKSLKPVACKRIL